MAKDTPATPPLPHWGGGGKCPIVSELKSHFSKNGYSLSVANRSDNQLFPIDEIMVNIPDMEWNIDGEINVQWNATVYFERFGGDKNTIGIRISNGMTYGFSEYGLTYTINGYNCDESGSGDFYLNIGIADYASLIEKMDFNKDEESKDIDLMLYGTGLNGNIVYEQFYLTVDNPNYEENTGETKNYPVFKLQDSEVTLSANDAKNVKFDYQYANIENIVVDNPLNNQITVEVSNSSSSNPDIGTGNVVLANNGGSFSDFDIAFTVYGTQMPSVSLLCKLHVIYS